MTQKSRNLFVLIVIGLFFVSIAVISLVTPKMPGSLIGAIIGIGIGLTFLMMSLKGKKF